MPRNYEPDPRTEEQMTEVWEAASAVSRAIEAGGHWSPEAVVEAAQEPLRVARAGGTPEAIAQAWREVLA